MHYQICAALTLAVVAGACNSKNPDHFEKIFDPCVATVVEAAPGTPDDWLTSIDEAIALWNDVARVGFTRAPVDNARRLPIVLVDTKAYMGWYNDFDGNVEMSVRLKDPAIRAVVLSHELGHALNLYHVDPDNRISVMNKGNRDVPPDEADAAALQRMWGDCVMR